LSTALLVAQPGPAEVLPADTAQTRDSLVPNPYSPFPGPYDTLDLSEHTVVFSVDDGYQTVFSYIYPLLKQHGMTITLAPIVNYLGEGKPSYQPGAGFLNIAEIREMRDSCAIEIASHSLSHPFLTRLDSAEAWAEISRSKAVLESIFHTEVITFVYPYGDANARIRRFTRLAGYKLGRAVRPGDVNLWVEPFRVPIFELRQETRLADVKHRVARHQTTILLLHQIVPQPTVFTQWNLADFADLLDWMESTGVRVATLEDLYREWWYERLGRFMEQVRATYGNERKSLLFEDVDVDATGAAHSR